MDEMHASTAGRTPGAVLFVAILNFLWSGAGFLFSLASILIMILGASAGVYDQIHSQLSQNQPPINLSFGVTFFFSAVLLVSLAFGVLFLVIGIGLVKKKRFAWYLQVAMSVLGLLGFPVGTIINGVILAFFFQSSTRNHFNV